MEGIIALMPLVSFIFMLLPLLVIVLITVYVVRLIRRTERRSEERLQLDKENAAIQQQQTKTIHELNERMIVIEKMLREVE